MAQDFYRPAALARMRGVMQGQQLHALDVRVASPWVAESNLGRIGLPALGPDRLIVEGAYDQPYNIANYRTTAFRTPAGRPVTYTRSVGTALDPRNLQAQVQSGVIFGLSSALYGEITFAKGAAEQSNFHDYAVLRLRQAPAIDVKVLEGGGPIRGIGETGVPPVAPALANAIFQATGKRFRELPLHRHVKFV